MNFVTDFKAIQKEVFGIEDRDLYCMTPTEHRDYNQGFDKSHRDKKHRITERLLDSLVSRARFVGNKTQRSFKRMIRSYAAIKMIMASGVFRKYAIGLSERTLKDALNLGSTEIAVDLCRLIFMHYNLIGDYKKAKKFHDLCFEYLEKQELEIKAQWYLSDLASSSKTLGKNQIRIKAAKYLADLYQIVPDSMRFNKALYLIMCLKYGFDGNYTRMAEVATKAMEYFKNLTYRHEDSEMIFKNYLMEALMKSNKIDQAEMLLTDTPITNLTTFKHAEILFRLLMRKNDFDKAQAIFNRLSSSKLQRQIEYTQPRLQLYRFYLGIVNQDAEIRRLKLDLKILTEIKDENIRHHLIISQILHNALYGDADYLSTNNALLKKIAKHKVNSKRAKIFIRMLLLIPIRLYDPNSFERRSSQLLAKLKIEPIDLEDLEILSYENIWESLTKRKSLSLRLNLTG